MVVLPLVDEICLSHGSADVRQRRQRKPPRRAVCRRGAADGKDPANWRPWHDPACRRKRLGLSAAECGLLLGASAQSIYNWEEGKVRLHAHLPAIFALRNLGRRRANEILETRKAT
jgi:hypothetical protein